MLHEIFIYCVSIDTDNVQKNLPRYLDNGFILVF